MEFIIPITRAREKGTSVRERHHGLIMSKKLNDLITPYLLRRSKTDVIQKQTGVEGSGPCMPSLAKKADLVCWIFLSDVQKSCYKEFLQENSFNMPHVSAVSNLAALTVLKRICDHPRLMKKQWKKLGLRSDVGDQLDTTQFSVSHIPDETLIEESGKMLFLVKLLDNLKMNGHRCLVFSQSRKLLDIIQQVVQNRGHAICRLDGSIKHLKDRQQIVDKFTRDGSFTVFLLTTQLEGAGLSLTAADRVVIFEPSWNPAIDSLAIDCANRIGQDKAVVVYRLITCGTIEEKIYRRQLFKDSVNQVTTGGTGSPFRFFTKHDMEDLFELSDTHISRTMQELLRHNQGMCVMDYVPEEHVVFLSTLDMFGISDHSLVSAGEAAVVDISSESETCGKKQIPERSSTPVRPQQATSEQSTCKIDFNNAMKKTRKFLWKADFVEAYVHCRKALEICPGQKEAEAVLRKLRRLLYKGNEEVGLTDDDGSGDVDGGDEHVEEPKAAGPIASSEEDSEEELFQRLFQRGTMQDKDALSNLKEASAVYGEIAALQSDMDKMSTRGTNSAMRI